MNKIIFIVAIILQGCASVPKETVMLSGEMGGMIDSAKTAHMALLDAYGVERRGRIDDYMAAVWTPRFIKTMANSGDLWGKTCNIKNTTDAALELQGFVEAAARQIAAKRKELTDALDETMADLRAALTGHYNTLEQANRAVTSNLRSVRSNDEVFDETLKRVKINPDVLTPFKDVSKKLDKLFD